MVDGEPPIVARNEAVISAARVDERAFAAATQRARAELEDARRVHRRRSRAAIAGRAAILVDDGVATGATARAALQAIRRRGAKR